MEVTFIWENWLLLAWIAPLAWGLGSLVDVFMIEQRVYRDPVQATVISSMVVSVPFLTLAFPSLDPTSLGVWVCILAMLGGISYLLMLLFYYKAMFTVNDAAHAESFLNLEVLFVPVLAFILLGEHLRGEHYLGIALASLGVLILNSRETRYFLSHSRLTGLLLVSVFASSCSLVIQDHVFTLTSYWNGIAFYAIGMLVGALIMVAFHGSQNIAKTFWRFRKPILAAELFTLVATFTELRAVDLSPSASLVAVIATSAPIMIMLVSLLAWSGLRFVPKFSPGLLSALRDQFDAAPAKLVANGLIIGGVYVISASALSR